MMAFRLGMATVMTILLLGVIIGSSTFAIVGNEDNSSTDSTATQSNSEKEKNTSRQSKQSLQEQKKQTEQAKRCEAIAVLGQKIKSQANERKQSIEAKRENASLTIAERAKTGQDELEQKRKQWDSQREENFLKLREKAKTDSQKAAVEDYIRSIKEAIAIRRAANDAAVRSFVENIAALKNQAQTDATQYTASTISAIDTAVVQATNDCNAGNDPQAVKTALKQTLDTIRKNAKNERQTGTVKSQIELLVKQRQDSVKINNENFKVATQKARTALFQAFNKAEQATIE